MVLTVTFYANPSFSGTPDPCGETNHPCCDGDGNYDPTLPTCPIDGGVVALLAAGVGYGLKRARDAKKEKEAVE